MPCSPTLGELPASSPGAARFTGFSIKFACGNSVFCFSQVLPTTSCAKSFFAVVRFAFMKFIVGPLVEMCFFGFEFCQVHQGRGAAGGYHSMHKGTALQRVLFQFSWPGGGVGATPTLPTARVWRSHHHQPAGLLIAWLSCPGSSVCAGSSPCREMSWPAGTGGLTLLYSVPSPSVSTSSLAASAPSPCLP